MHKCTEKYLCICLFIYLDIYLDVCKKIPYIENVRKNSI